MKAKHCDECKNSVVKEVLLTCALGHKPRFFKPRYIHDYQWGWKRNCTDYEQIAKHRETEAAERAGKEAATPGETGTIAICKDLVWKGGQQ